MWFEVAYVACLLGATGAVIYLAHRKLHVSDDGRWVANAELLASEVRAVVADADADDFGLVQRRLVPLSSRLDGHLRAAPPEADPRLLRRVHELGVECRTVGMEHPFRDPTETPLREKLATLDAMAQAVQRVAESTTDSDSRRRER